MNMRVWMGVAWMGLCAAGCATSSPYAYREETDDAALASRSVGRNGAIRAATTGTTAIVDDFAHFTLAAPTGDRATSALLIEKVSPREARLNRPFDYKLRVTNLTSAVLTDVVVRERLPESFALTKSEPPVASVEGGWARYNVGELGPLASRTIDVTGVPHAEGTMASAIGVDYGLAARTEASVVNPILKLTKEAPADADICEGIRYRYVAANIGTGTERGVVIEDKLPEGLITDEGKSVFRFEIGDLGQGVSREVIVRVKPLKTGTYGAAAVARASGGAEVKSNQVSTIVHQPALEVAISGPPSEYLNKSATYTVTVKNTGDVPAKRAAVIIDTAAHGQVIGAVFKDGAPVVEAKTDRAALVADRRPPAKLVDGGVEIGTLAPGESVTVSVSIKATVEGPMTVTARAMATCASEASARADTKVLTLAALRLEVVDLDDPIRVGDHVTYRISVKNQGTAPDHHIALTASLPAGLKFASAQGPTDGVAAGQTITFAALDVLKPGETATWLVEAKATGAGDVRFNVRLKSDALTEPAAESEPTRLY